MFTSRGPRQPRSHQRDGELIGWGSMAASTFPALRGNASAKVRLLPDGRVQVLASANNMGTGSYTVIAIVTAETLGMPADKITTDS
ncbi:molybdopterin cofactor-binding domain-containing protein [Trichothermofontia sp.]